MAFGEDVRASMRRASRPIAVLGIVFAVIAVVLLVLGRYLLAVPAVILTAFDLGLSALLRSRSRAAP